MSDRPPAKRHTTPQMEEGEVAESNRRGKRAVDEHPDDEVFADAVDDDALDAVDDETDDFDDDLDGSDVATTRRRGAVARRDGTAVTGAAPRKPVKPDRAVKIGDESPGLGGRIARFIREVVAELRKVNWPSRKELLTYASVVIVFVVIMMSIVGLLDYGFAWVVGHVFAG
jgi:preprotein translocase subunit SecE